MPRNISFALTIAQFKARTKTVTRRMGWEDLKPGTILMGVEKAQGLGKGGKIVRLGPIRVLDVRPERLTRLVHDPVYGFEEVRKEGCPNGIVVPSIFVAFFCRSHKGCTPDSEVTRIEYEYVEIA